MSAHKSELQAAVGVSATFECRDDAGNILKTITLTGTIPLADLQDTTEQGADGENQPTD